MGVPQIAVPTLERLESLGANVVAVYTKAPKPAGRRGLEITKTAVHCAAEALKLPVLTPKSLRSPEAASEMRALNAEVAIVIAYGLILPSPILSTPGYGCLNLHGSLLPRWRGAAPIQRAIMAGDQKTGVDLMRMDEGLDTGPVACTTEIDILPHFTSGDLTDHLSRMAADLLQQSWPQIVVRNLEFKPQPLEGATYAKKIEKSEAIIDWAADAVNVRNQIHGLSPFPGAYSAIRLGAGLERIKILRAESVHGNGRPGELLDDKFRIACGTGAVRAIEVQRAGKGPVRAEDFLRGARLREGNQFVSAEQLSAAFDPGNKDAH